MTDIALTTNEKEQAKQQAIRSLRKRLELTKPDHAQYQTGESSAVKFIASTLIWAKAFVPVIALLAAIASAVRTVQTASEIYTAAGSHWLGVLLAAIAFTVAAEGALFTLALAQEGQRMKLRTEKRERRVASLKNAWHGILVRVGVREPLRHDELPESDGLSIVMWIAFAFAVASNAYLGLRPLVSQIGSVSLQGFMTSILTADAQLQMTFIVDLAAVLFPPLMALNAGHLTARFAAELAESSQAIKTAYQRDLERWNASYADPLATDAGRELIETLYQDKLAAKQSRRTPSLAKSEPVQITPIAVEPENAELDFLPANPVPSSNGHH